MMAKFIAWRTADDARPPLVVIDIGYSEKETSCGVWWSGSTTRHSHQFYRAVDVLTEQLNSILAAGMRPLLVVEAPLSRAHRTTGNPTPRGEFETLRRWYVQSGAVTCMAALRLLEVLSERLTGDVWIAEAFLSVKDEGTLHWRDAMDIHNQFWNASPIVPASPVASPLTSMIDGIPEVRVFQSAIIPE